MTLVSMPLLGLIPFLQIIETLYYDADYCVNALTRAYPISTVSAINIQILNDTVSMPLLGLIPFLLSN